LTAHNSSGITSKATRLALLTLTWVAFLLRVVALDWQSLWRDEVDAIRFSDWPVAELVTGLIRVGHNGPLYFLLLRPWRVFVGDTEFALRYPSALLGVFAVPLGFMLARQLRFNRFTGLILGLLMATSPYLIWYGQEAKMYTLLPALITLAFIAYLKALAGTALPSPIGGKKWPWVWWVIFVIATTLSYYVHILAPLMLSVYAVTAFLLYPQLRRHRRGWLISMGILILPYIPLGVWQAPRLLAGYQSGHPFYSFKDQFYLLLQLYSSGLVHFAPADLFAAFSSPDALAQYQTVLAYLQTPSFKLVPIVLFVFLFLSGLLLKPIHKTKTTVTHRLILLTWALLPPLIVYFVSLRVHIFEDRYLIYIIPPFYLLVASGLVKLWPYSRWFAGLGLILVLLFNLTGIWQQQRLPRKADFRAAAAYLVNQPRSPSTIMIHLSYLQYTFDYYYPYEYTRREGLWTNDGKTEHAVDAEMTSLTADLSDLWLVVSEEDLWDNRHLTRAWLNKNGEFVDEAHFVGVDVYHYRLRPGTIESQSGGN